MPGGVGGARASLASTRFGRGVSEKDRKAPRRGPTSADPTGEKARAVKARYQGVCRGCGAYTQPRNGKGDAYAHCKACHPGAIERRWTRERVLEAMREWRSRFGTLPSSYDWSRTHARRRGGPALERLAKGGWPAASVVTAVWGSWPAARSAAGDAGSSVRLASAAGGARRVGDWAQSAGGLRRSAQHWGSWQLWCCLFCV